MSHDERMAEVIWEAHLQRIRLRNAGDEMVSLGLSYAEIRDRMKDLEDELLGPLLVEAEEVHKLAVEEQDYRVC